MSFAKRMFLPRYSLRFLLLGITLLAGLLTFYVHHRSPSQAVALLLFEGSPPLKAISPADLPFEYDSFLGNNIREYNRSLQESLPELIKSPAVLKRTVANGKVNRLSLIRKQRDPITYLSNNLSVSTVGKSELVIVSFSDQTSKTDELATILNTVVAEYLQYLKFFDFGNDQLQRNLAEILAQEEFKQQRKLIALYEQLFRLQADEKPTDNQKRAICIVEKSIAIYGKRLDAINRQRMVLQADPEPSYRVTLKMPATGDIRIPNWWELSLNW